MPYQDLSRDQLVQVVDALADEVDRWEHAAKKARADLENYKKQQGARRERWQRQARQDIAEDMLSVVDNLERALDAADEDSPVVDGVAMVREELLETLARHGLERIEADSEFDPHVHEAVETVDGDEPRRIVDVRQPGYRYEDTVVRPAQVVITDTEGA